MIELAHVTLWLNYRFPWLVVYKFKKQFRSSNTKKIFFQVKTNSSSIDKKEQLSIEKGDGKKQTGESQKHCCLEDFSLLIIKSHLLLLYHIMNSIHNVHESSWLSKSVVLSHGCESEWPFEFNNIHQTK